MPDSYRFGSAEVRPAERALLIGGAPVALGGRAFDLLVALLERPGKLVTKDELLDAVWGRVIVEEGNLHVHISTLRKLLGAGLIVTIPGRGYRLETAAGAAAQPVAEAATRGGRRRFQPGRAVRPRQRPGVPRQPARGAPAGHDRGAGRHRQDAAGPRRDGGGARAVPGWRRDGGAGRALRPGADTGRHRGRAAIASGRHRRPAGDGDRRGAAAAHAGTVGQRRASSRWRRAPGAGPAAGRRRGAAAGDEPGAAQARRGAPVPPGGAGGARARRKPARGRSADLWRGRAVR
ncbi:MAG: transcriptional regulator [Betaproteobacteria bacterium]|nr:transcriptional regulator [Betaproteobacteria bacterium]